MGTTCRSGIASAVVGWLACAVPAQAALTLAAAGIANGFSLSTFIIGDNPDYPVLTAADVPGGALLVGSDSHDAVYRFRDHAVPPTLPALRFTHADAVPRRDRVDAS